VSGRPSAAELLERPEGFLTRTDLAALGLPRTAIDAAFRALPVVAFPGTRRPLIRVEDFRAFVAEHTYNDDRVRAT
jgi:hypothetical protein